MTTAHAQIDAPPHFGNWTVGHQVLNLAEDDGARRAMDVDLWFPTSADPSSTNLAQYGNRTARFALATTEVAASDPLSLIVYSHGTGGDSVENSFFAESLASHGFMVAATTHQDGGVPPIPSSTHDRPRDVQSIIDVLFDKTATESDPLHETINTAGVGVAGFSFGGFTSLAAAAGTNSGPTMPDERIKAIMPIARGSFLEEPVSLTNVHIPTLLFAGEDDDFGLDNRLRTEDLRRLAATDKFAAIVDGADHGDVGVSRCQQSPATTACPNDDAMEIESILAVSFFQRYLQDDATFSDVLSQSYALQHEPPFEFWQSAVTDTNNDKRTDFADFLKLSEEFGKTGREALRSGVDFDRDRLVGFADFLLLAQNFSGSLEAPAAVPEPSAFGLLVLASICLLALRQRTAR